MQADTRRIDIGICTFRRAHLRETLDSLARLDCPAEWDVRIVVADNDDTPSARALVEAVAATHPFTLDYVHAPARNISLARNACLDAATGDYLAFIDDDERADPHWLQALVEALESAQADVALGPVDAAYDETAPRWMRDGAFHNTRPVWVDGTIITGYSCNVLFKRLSPAVHAQHFRPELGRTGGEDTFFFAAIHEAGGRITYAPNARVYEPVPPARARLQWLLTRRFRAGQTHALWLLEQAHYRPVMRLSHSLRAGMKWFYCYLMALPFAFSRRRAAGWLLRGTLHAGVISRLWNSREVTPYGQ